MTWIWNWLCCLLLGLSCSVFFYPASSSAHMEDALGCEAVKKEILKKIPKGTKATQTGISQDERDYIMRYELNGIIYEVHFALAPRSQWADPKKPEAYLPGAISWWADLDGDGVLEHWFLTPRQSEDCKDTIHFMLDPQSNEYWHLAHGEQKGA